MTSIVTRFVHSTDMKPMCTSVDLVASSPNRVLVVKTFATLISQRQTLVSSGTSCAV